MVRELKPCGTEAAYCRHLRHGEKPCDPCREATNARRRGPDGKPLQPAQHGTVSKYHSGCRCEDCTRANTDHQRAWREAVAALPADFVPHGLNGYRNYGCRCATCRAAASENNRTYREQRKKAAA